MLNRCTHEGQFVPDLVNVSVAPLRTMLVLLFVDNFYQFKEVPFYPKFTKTFLLKVDVKI